MICIELFWEFFKTGLFAIGGGMSTVPFLMNISEKTGWFTASELADMIAVSESTPGPIGVNMATYVGFKTYGLFGSLIATSGLILPSVIIIELLSAFLLKFSNNKIVNHILGLIRASVIGLIIYALLNVMKICFFDNESFLIMPFIIYAVYCCLIYKCKKIHPLIWIITGALVGIVLF